MKTHRWARFRAATDPWWPIFTALSGAATVVAVGCSPVPAGSNDDAVGQDGAVTNPDGSVVMPDGSIVMPDGTVVPPEDNTSGTGGATGGGDASTCVPGVPVTTQLPFLTKVQYDNTVADLLLIGGNPSESLAPDIAGSVGDREWSAYQAVAASLAAKVMADPTSLAQVVPCTLPAADEDACAQGLIQQFGALAFRRPLTDEETTRFSTLYASRASITATGSFDEILEIMIEGFLLSPSFLMRGEVAEVAEGEKFALTGYEVASRLSYLLWASMPDDALFAAAASGGLATSEGILSEARRMLTDDRAKKMVGEFHRDWLGMDYGNRWSDVSRDPAVYPDFTDAVVPAMAEETMRFVDHIVQQDGTFQDLINTPVGFVNKALAPLYGFNAAEYSDTEYTQVPLDPTERAGILTRTGFLVSHGKYEASHPILRGAFVQKEILCTEIAAPPPGAESTELPTEFPTNRERVDAQTAPATCANCHHGLINPTGFAFETYDGIGAVQVEDGGLPINAQATIPIGDRTVDVNGPVEFMTEIANAPEAHLCYARHWVKFAYERPLTNEDACTAEKLAEQITGDGYTIRNLITDLTQSEQFRYRAVGPAEVAQ